MTDIAVHLNGLSVAEASRALHRCCDSNRWVEAMLDLRPYADKDAIHIAGEMTWWNLEEGDWLEAFGAHPRIGATELSDRWSSEEQSGVAGASAEVLQALAATNREYEDRFGFVFLISASGLDAEEMLETLKRRLNGSPAEELRIAAAEHVKITALRLDRMADKD